MDEQPQYQPESWVIFKHLETIRFGKIVGGLFRDREWLYVIENPLNKGIFKVKESDVFGLLKK